MSIIENENKAVYKQEYRFIRGISDFKNNYILNHASFTYDCKLFNRMLNNNLIYTYSSKNLQDTYVNEMYNTRDPHNIEQEKDITSGFYTLKYKRHICVGCFILRKYPEEDNPQPYDIQQVINIEYDYSNVTTYKDIHGTMTSRPEIKTLHCRQLRPNLILEYRDEQAKVCTRIFKYTKDSFLNCSIFLLDRLHDKYVYNPAPYMFFIPNFADYPLNNSIFV